MSKYIDAEKLITEIKRREYEVFPTNDGKVRACSTPNQMQSGWLNALTWMLKHINSLQQDDTQVDKMLCSQTWWEEQGWIMIPPDATIKGIDSLLKQVRKKLQQEQQEVELQEEINRFWDSCIKHKNERGSNVIWSNKLEVEVLARHFYELGLKARKEE